ncbi:MAG: hypothetical protein KDI33_09975 [Halioglobus sp.]|nr:hypothetical protein [Halioglobus sp.]
MFAAKFGYVIERAIIVAVCLWGNWAIYYWVAVLLFDASYADLKVYLPLLLLQIAASLLFLSRTDLEFSNARYRCSDIYEQPRMRRPGSSFITLATCLTLLAVLAVVAAHHFQLTESSLPYNLFWALLLPFSLACSYYRQTDAAGLPVPATAERYRWDNLDCLLLLGTSLALAVSACGSGFPTGDDAFYGHVMSSTLANPDFPVQGQDLLLNTNTPYTLHPAYRGVGYEVLIALISEAVSQRPTFLYFSIAPVLGAVMWCFAAYLFMRAMRSPYPGLAVAVFFLLLLFWGSDLRHAPSGLLVNNWWGKSLVLIVAAPLLFSAVAAYAQMQTLRTWLLLFLAVCTVAIWSSTALFVVPLAVAMACLVFLPFSKKNLSTMLTISLSLAPILLLILHGLLVLRSAPVGAGGTGSLDVLGEEFGGLPAKAAVLVILLILPFLARSIRDAKFQSNVLRICMIGVFTVMAPFFIETIAVVTGLNLLSFRLPAAYPGILLLGVMASIALTHLVSTESTRHTGWRRGLVPALVLMLYALLLATIDLEYAHTKGRKYARTASDFHWREAESARELIPGHAVVAAGAMDAFLPMLPDPPAFISVRHYLRYHRHALSASEYAERKYLQSLLEEKRPRDGDSLEITMNNIVAIADRLKVTTMVFYAEKPNSFAPPDPEKQEFVAALMRRLTRENYRCAETPWGVTIVCNR